MISRRRFLAVSASMAAFAAVPAQASTMWRGRAFGADVSVTLTGDKTATQAAMNAALDTIRRMEKLFSLYDPSSALSALNRSGSLMMSPEFSRLIDICDQIHNLSDGLFDPTVQPLFAAMLKNGGVLNQADRQQLHPMIGWQNVSRNGSEIRFLRPGMALTLNGIAQGFATDRVTEILAAHGFTDAIVNIGEYRVGNDFAPLGIENSEHKGLARSKLSNAAIATTSANGYSFADGTGHVLRPDLTVRKARWKTVSVIARTAAIADGLSTSLALAKNETLARSLHKSGVVHAILLEDMSGNVEKIGAL